MAAALVAATGLSLTGPASATTRTTTVYVANYLSGTITPINAATDTAGPPIGVIGQPYMLAATPDGRTVYVVSVDNRPAPPQSYVTPINTVTGKPGTPIPNVAGPMAIAPDGKTLYVLGGGGILPIDTATMTAGTPIRPSGSDFGVMQVSPDGKTLYALAANGFLDRIAVATGKPEPAARVRGELESMAITPGGRNAFVGQSNTWGHVVPVNLVTGIRGPDVPGPRSISAMALAPGGRTLWALGGATNTAVPIDTATDQPGRPVATGDSPVAIVIVRHS